jgi:hypothetical protein
MPNQRACLTAICFLSAFFAFSPILHGQATGSLSGTVSDKAGAVLSGALVKATSQDTGLVRETRTDDSGHYLIPVLPVSFYTLRVESQGFQSNEQKDIRLQVDEHREVDFSLAPASVTSTVEVSATEVAVETANPTLGQVITSEQVAELPLNGRDFVQLATLTPGTTQETNPQSFFNGGASSEVSARGTFSLSVGGSRAQSTDWLLDGNDNNELTSGGISIFSSIDDIQEFKVLTYNYSAEYGTRAGPTVLVTTKSGSNQYHGSLFEYFRNTKLDARSYFASSREQFNLNQFGGSFGGPIQKDKTFFFLDYQAKQQRHGIPFVGLVPTAAMKTGDFRVDPFILNSATPGLLANPYAQAGDPANFQCVPGTQNLPTPTPEPINGHGGQAPGTPCNYIPSGLIDPVGQSLIDLYPTGTSTFSSIGTDYSNVPVRKLNEGQFDVRLDHTFSGKDSIFARFSYDQALSFVPGGSPGFAEQSPFASTQIITNHGRNVAVSETHVLSDRTINQASAGFNRIFNHINSWGDFGGRTCTAALLGIQGADLSSQCDSITGYPASLNQSTQDCLSCGLSSIQMTDYWSLGDRGFAPFQGGTNVYSVSDTLDMIRGKHNVRFGIGIRANQMNVRTNGFQDGYFLLFAGGYTGDNAADLLLGQVGGAIHDQTFDGATTGRRWKMYRPFVQDDWRVTPNVTVNLGLAWALVTPESEAGNRQANFDFQTGKYLVAGNSPQRNCSLCVPSGPDVGVQFDKTALEPRIGVSWKPSGSQTTAVRAGYAIFHDSAWSQGAQGLWQNPPYYAEADNFSGLCPFGNSTSATPLNCGIQRGLLQSPNEQGQLLPIESQPNPGTFTGTIQSQNLNFKQGMVQQFNLNVERQLPANVVLTVGYAGSRSTRILVDGLNQNVGSPAACIGGADYVPGSGYTLGCGPGGQAFGPAWGPPNPNFPDPPTISNITDNGRARYDSLQVKAEAKSIRHGLYALVGYTWSRTFDSGFPDGDGTPPGATYWPLPGTQRADWSLSQLNLNNAFTASVLYNLPFGKGKKFGSAWSGPVNAIVGDWKATVIEKATSGFPLFAVASDNNTGVNFQWNGNSLNRPNEISDPLKAGVVSSNPNIQCQYLAGSTIPNSTLLGIAPTQVRTLQNWFNPCAFADALPGELGDSARAPLYGPRFVNTDFSLIKDFPLSLRDGMNLEFRAEFFNILNHAQFFLGGGSSGMQDVDSISTFGVVNETVNNPRVIQFALRLDF